MHSDSNISLSGNSDFYVVFKSAIKKTPTNQPPPPNLIFAAFITVYWYKQ